MINKSLLFIIIFSFTLTFFFGTGYAKLYCDVLNIPGTGMCPPPYTTQSFMRLSAFTNAHAAYSSETNYPWQLCCWDDTGTMDQTCNQPFLYLSATTNAHAGIPGQTIFSVPVCLSRGENDYTCEYKQACDSGQSCALSISDVTNAHVANCTGPGTYNTKVCCNLGVNNPPSLTTLTAYSSNPDTQWVGVPGTPAALFTISGYVTDPDGDYARIRCGTTQHSTNLCTSGSAATPATITCGANAPWSTSGTKTFWCYPEDNGGAQGSDVSSTINADVNYPTIDIIEKSPNFVGKNTIVTYTVSGAGDTGGSGLYQTQVVTNGVVRQTCYAGSCQYVQNGGFSQGSTVTYTGYAKDRAGNNNNTIPLLSFQVCDLTNVQITPNCAGSCKQGDTLQITATFTGACPTSVLEHSYIQIDARSADGSCRIEHDDPTPAIPNDWMAGINIDDCTASPCTKTWTLPAIPSGCSGDTINYQIAALWKNDVTGNSEDRFADFTPTGSFNLYDSSAGPYVLVNNTPQTGITTATPVKVNATAWDNNNVKNISLFVYNSAMSLVHRQNCIASPMKTPFDCEHQQVYSTAGTYYYNASSHDDENNVGWSNTQNFTVQDTTPPVVSVSHSPAEIGQLTDVTFTATASDPETGVAQINISVYRFDGLLRNSTLCSSSPCVLTLYEFSKGEVILYNATAINGQGLKGYDPASGFKTFTACSLDSAAIEKDVCTGTDGGCRKGDKINVTVNYHGACTSTNSYIQIDATDGEMGDNRCDIQHNGGDVSGIDIICTSQSCKGQWTIPGITDACLGETVTSNASALWKTSIGSGQWFSGVNPTGSFTFTAMTDTVPDIRVVIDPPTPPYTDSTPIFLNATATDDHAITYVNISIDGFLDVQCTANPPKTPFSCSTTPRTFSAGTHTYKAAAKDDTGNENFVTGLFDVTSGPDTTPPTVTATHTPAEIKYDTQVYIDVTADDTGGSGVDEINIYINSVLNKTCDGAGQQTAQCQDRVDAKPSGIIVSYISSANDTTGNERTLTKRYGVCNLSIAAVLNTQCTGPNNECKPGDTIGLMGYRPTSLYACPQSNSFLQVDASSDDGSCIITADSVPISGLSRQCNFGDSGILCIGGFAGWLVPSTIPLQCMGQTMKPTAAALWKNQILLPGEWWDSADNLYNSFKFYFDSTNVELNVSLSLSQFYVNYRDNVIANLSCVLKRGAEQAPCSNDIAVIENITINDKNYLFDENWNQDANYLGNGVWKINISTLEYNQPPTPSGTPFSQNKINITLRYESLSNKTSKTYIVNWPPEMSNINHTPNPALVGQPITFNATLKDPDWRVTGIPSRGVDTARVCKDTQCAVQYCKMNLISGSPNSYVNYSCTYPAVQPTDKYYYIWANDTRGAWNVSAQQQLLPIDEEIVVNLTIVGANVTIPFTPTGEPNFTRGIDIEYKSTAFVRNRTNGLFIEDCNGDFGGNCDAFDPSHTQIDWDGFVDAWKGNYSSAGYTCDQYNDFEIIVERNDGLSGVGVVRIFISCEPRLVVDPIERRLALGQNNMEIFKLTLYNPQNAAAFTIRMNSQDPNGWPLPWVRFDCDGNNDCGYVDLDNDVAVLSVNAVSSGTIFVNMSSGGRAGVYPIEFIANKTTLDKYTTIGTLMIFAESLDEFALWQLAVILLIAGLIYVGIGRKK